MRLRRYRPLLASALVLACAPGAPPSATTPLVDGRHAPLVLTEGALLDKPPAYSGNRFVAGWWPGSRGRSPSQVNVGDRAVMEAVFLDGRERRLVTRLDILEAESGATFGVRIAGVDLPPQPLMPDVEVPLPGGLPLGRLPIEIDLRGARVEIEAIGFGHAWQAGVVELAPETILQGGYSAIDFPRRLRGPATLVGRFEPPQDAEPDQRYAVLVGTDSGEPEVAFEWFSSGRGGYLRPRPIELSLPAGFVRIRLLAQGLGPAGRWRGLGLAGADDASPDDTVELTSIEAREGIAYVATSKRFQLIKAPGLGLVGDADSSRDGEYVFDLRQDPQGRHNLAGATAVEIDWLRARLDAWIERDAAR